MRRFLASLFLLPLAALGQQVVYQYTAWEGSVLRIPVNEETAATIVANTNGVFMWQSATALRQATDTEVIKATDGLNISLSAVLHREVDIVAALTNVTGMVVSSATSGAQQNQIIILKQSLADALVKINELAKEKSP